VPGISPRRPVRVQVPMTDFEYGSSKGIAVGLASKLPRPSRMLRKVELAHTPASNIRHCQVALLQCNAHNAALTSGSR
jgi:hypothetical protein